MNETLDEHELQRLLDGNLTSDERILLLRYAEEHPFNWRRIAMAFIEEQVLRNELAQLQISEFSSASAEPLMLSDLHAETRLHRSKSNWLAQAAVICLVLGAAVWLGRVSATPSAPSPSTTAEQRTEISPLRQASGDSIASSSNVSQPRRMTHQAMESTKHEDQTTVAQMFTPLFDQETLAVFQQYGYTVEEEPVIYVVPGQSGEQYFVPRRNVSLVSHRD